MLKKQGEAKGFSPVFVRNMQKKRKGQVTFGKQRILCIIQSKLIKK